MRDFTDDEILRIACDHGFGHDPLPADSVEGRVLVNFARALLAAAPALAGPQPVAYRIEHRADSYTFVEAKHQHINRSLWQGARVMELLPGRIVHEPPMDEEVTHLFPSVVEDMLPAHLRADAAPQAEAQPAPQPAVGEHGDVIEAREPRRRVRRKSDGRIGEVLDAIGWVHGPEILVQWEDRFQEEGAMWMPAGDFEDAPQEDKP